MKLVKLIKMRLNETYGKVRIGIRLSNSSPVQISLKQADALSPLLSNFALEYVISKVQENLVVPKLNGTQQLLACADDINLLVHNIDTMKKTQKLEMMPVRRLV
jgi:hypothetical protein